MKALRGKVPSREMEGLKGKIGNFTYLGIKKELSKRISLDIYKEEVITVVIFVDGAPIDEDTQMWPNLMMILNKKYRTRPFPVAIYTGKTKPKSAEDFFFEFVEEAIDLTVNGIVISEKKFKFELVACICDTQGRCFVKCTKGPTGFYSCERCTTQGQSVKTGDKNKRGSDITKRVFPEDNAPLRTRESFENQEQSDHHLHITPLLRIPGFDPVRGVPLDSMHLFFEGALPIIFKFLTTGRNKGRLRASDINLLIELLKHVSPSLVPDEFQRKFLDFEHWEKWKATQSRLFLLYIGFYVFKKVLSRECYQHFLSLTVGTRILCSEDVAVQKVDTADECLRKFFNGFPVYYGNCTQVLNLHNLIHVSDDVRFFQLPLTYLTAFPGENVIGKLVGLKHGPVNYHAQIIRRLHELDMGSDIVTRKNVLLSSCEKHREFSVDFKSCSIHSFMYKGLLISEDKPNNLVRLEDGNLFEISSITSEKHREWEPEDLVLTGRIWILEGDGSFFQHHGVKSTEIGITTVKTKTTNEYQCSASVIVTKSMLLDFIPEYTVAVDLLHKID